MASRRSLRNLAPLAALIAAASAGLGGCVTAPPREPFEASVARVVHGDPLEATVRKLAQPLIDSRRNIGMVIAVSTPEGEGVYTLGSKDLDGKVPMTRDAVFQVGSVSKSLTTVLAAQLELQHKVDLNAPVAALVPPDMVPESNDLTHVTLAELGSHTSGMAHEAYSNALLWGVITYLVNGENLYRFLDTPHLYDYIDTAGFTLPREKTYAYSNIGMVYLGFLLGQVDHKGYARLLQEEVLKPLALTHTGLSLTNTKLPELTPGYAGDLPTFVARHRPVPPWLFDEGISAAGAVYSTADDLLTYAKENLGLIPTPLLPAMQRTHAPIAPAEGGQIGLAWFLKTLPDTQQPYTYIAGITGGHTSFVGFDERRKVSVVVLQNSINHDDMIGVMLLDRLVGAEIAMHEGVPLTRIRRTAGLPTRHRPLDIASERPSVQRSK